MAPTINPGPPVPGADRPPPSRHRPARDDLVKRPARLADPERAIPLGDRLEIRPDEPVDGTVPDDAKELANELEAMGPTFVKLGQLLSTRPDLIPRTYADALTRLQDKVEPFDGEEAERIVSEELGVRVSLDDFLEVGQAVARSEANRHAEQLGAEVRDGTLKVAPTVTAQANAVAAPPGN